MNTSRFSAAMNTNLLPRSGNVVRLAGSSGAASPIGGMHDPEEHAADPHNSSNGPVANCANSTHVAHGRQSLTPSK